MSDLRPRDPRDKRDYVPPIALERLDDPLDHPVAHPRANVPDPRGADPRDMRQPGQGIEDAFRLPDYALAGQAVTSTFGRVYQFDGRQWREGASTLASSYTFRIGIDETSPGIVDVMPARALPGEIGGINEPSADGLYLRSALGTTYTWTLATAGTAYIWGTALTEAPPGTINVDPATSTTIGGMTEPTADGNWMRNAAGAVYSWVPAAAGALTFDTGLTLTGTSVTLDPALPPGGEIGGINEPPADTGLQYTRSYTAGVGIWTQTTAGGYTWGIGLDELPPGSANIDLIAATATVLGGVSVVARSLTQGLALDALGALTGPLATDLLAGSIVEPPPDGLNYLRVRSTAGVSSWVQGTGMIWGIGIDEAVPGTVDLQPANFTPGEIGGITADIRSLTQGLLLDDVTGLLTAPLATDLLAGAIVEPLPSDTILYARKRTVAGVSTWEPVQAGAFVGDAPPPAPNTQGQFWFESDTGKLFVFFDDGNSTQWVQVGGV